MKIVTDTRDALRLTAALRTIPKGMSADINVALRTTAKDVAAGARRYLRQNRTPPSRPGDPPALDTGFLSKSIRFKKARRSNLFLVYALKDAFWSLFLEGGTAQRFTKDKSVRRTIRFRERKRKAHAAGKVDERPFLTRALSDNTDVMQKRIGAAIEKTLRDAVR